MDAGLAIKPVTSVANGHAQPAIALNPSKVTELPGAKIVKPLVKSEATVEERKTAQKSTTHDAIIDPETREVVYRILDSRTRQVIHQVPDQALLRKQAYARAQAAQALADGENPISATQVASHKVDALT
jgi:hypothetical protein